MTLRTLTLVALAAGVVCAAPAGAQTVPFGKNKIQYQDFDWRVLRGSGTFSLDQQA